MKLNKIHNNLTK